MTAKAASKALGRKEVTITRVLAAGCETVFEAWTDRKQLAAWWGPHGFTNPVCEVEAWTGGALDIVMRGPDGTDYPMKGVFQKVAPPSQLAFTSAALDPDGKPLLEVFTTVDLIAEGGKTRLALHAHAIALVEPALAMIDGMEMGWIQSIDRLQALLAARSSSSRFPTP
jgi:uncharacterized protein YndB with AHSA1/START domain